MPARVVYQRLTVIRSRSPRWIGRGRCRFPQPPSPSTDHGLPGWRRSLHSPGCAGQHPHHLEIAMVVSTARPIHASAELRRPLLVTADSDLLDDLVRIADRVGIRLNVAADALGARRWYESA